MKFLNSNYFFTLTAFITGGLLTFFVTDYIHLKKMKQSTLSLESKQSTTNTSKRLNNNIDLFNQADQFHNQMRKRMDSFFGDSFFDHALLSNDYHSFSLDKLKVNKFEDDRYKYVEVYITGIDKESLDIEVSNGMISISGEYKEVRDDNNSKSRSMGSYVSQFSKKFNIPQGVNEDNVKIETKQDKIIIKFPKQWV